MTRPNRLLLAALPFCASVLASGAGSNTAATIYSFDVCPTGNSPVSELASDAAGNLYGVTAQGGDARSGGGVVFEISAAGTYSVLHEFGTIAYDGFYPQGALTVLGGKLYGTTSAGGEGAQGTVFSMDLDGAGYAILHSLGFRQNDGE